MSDVDPPLVVRRCVPLLTVEDVVDDDLAARLIRHGDQQGWVRSPMLRPADDGSASLVPDVEAKARHDHVLDDPGLTSELQQRFVERLLPAVTTCFALPITAHEAFKVVRYDAGDGWFTAHRDNVTEDAAHRRLAVTVNLGDDHEGGHLRFPQLGPEEFRPRSGAAIVFSCALLHEVTPVTRGRRHALITFLW